MLDNIKIYRTLYVTCDKVQNSKTYLKSYPFQIIYLFRIT
jgi:hypothetical protein